MNIYCIISENTEGDCKVLYSSTNKKDVETVLNSPVEEFKGLNKKISVKCFKEENDIIKKIKKIERKIEHVQINNIIFEYHYISTGKDRLYIHSNDTNTIITVKYDDITSAVFKDEDGNELLRI